MLRAACLPRPLPSPALPPVLVVLRMSRLHTDVPPGQPAAGRPLQEDEVQA